MVTILPDRVVGVLITSFPAGPWQANCYLVAAAAGEPCVVIDPGMGAGDSVQRIVTEQRLRVASVLTTHGHVDHVAAAAAIADRHSVEVLIHAEDQHLLTDPLAGIGAFAAPLLQGLFGSTTLKAPQRVSNYADADVLELAGIRFTVQHAPGHTRGSALLGTHDESGQPIVFTGDVLFAGSIGRTDLPGGDPQVMGHTLEAVVKALPDAALVLPGHGPHSSIEQERRSNPWLQPGARM